MGKLSETLRLAQARAVDLKLPYAGALTPREANEIWQLAPGAKLVDVRTRAEWDWVGRIAGAVEIEWMTYPEMKANPNFLAQLKTQVDHESLVMFLCRSGQRSHSAAAAATQAGWSDCYNVLEGFEGERDTRQQRGQIGGWRHAGLPWEQK